MCLAYIDFMFRAAGRYAPAAINTVSQKPYPAKYVLLALKTARVQYNIGNSWKGPFNMKRILLALAFIFTLATAFAQIPANPIGINPASLKWQQIQTDKVQVIFPLGLDSAGRRVANLVHYLWDHHNTSIGEKMIPITILLQNQTVLSNGFVTPGPFRSEYYTMSPQFNTTTSWLDHLTIHEYRHVKQFGNADQGISKVVRDVLGSWPWGGMFGLALPRWFFEGDATGMETALTRSGRGRLPAFDMEYRTLVLNDVDYGYEKAGAGSLRDFVPNWYQQGYYMTTYARKHFGKDIWAGVLEDAVRYKGLFYPFSRSLKRRTGLSTRDLYQATYQELDSLWASTLETKANRRDPANLVNLDSKKTVTHYNNPHHLDDGSILAEKRAYNRIPTYIRIDPMGREEKIVTPGPLFNPEETTLSRSRDLICWAEVAFDERWRNETYSVIKTYSLTNRTKRQLTRQSQYFSPALSHDGKSIVAVEATELMQYSLVILDAKSGEVIKKLPNQGSFFYAYPRWTEDDEQIVVVANRDELGRLLLVDIRTGKTSELTPPTPYQLSHPFARGEYVYYSGTYTGTNNIYAVRIRDGQVFQITDVATGAFQPSVSAGGDKLLYSEFDLEGFNIREQPLSQSEWRAVDPQEQSFGIQYFQPLVEQEGGSIIDKVPNLEFPVKKYNKWSGIINPHSLLPYIGHPIYGLQLLSDNKFSTLSASANAYYNFNEEEFSFFGDVRYAELYPVLGARFAHANRSGLFVHYEPIDEQNILQTIYAEEWVENDVSAGVSLPLNFSAGNAITRLNLSSDFHYISIGSTKGGFENANNPRDTFEVNNSNNFTHLFKAPIQQANFNALDLRMSFFSIRRSARQHLNPRLGLSLGLRFRSTLNSDLLTGDQLIANGTLFLPGFSRNHSFFINSMYQRQDLLDNYRFSNIFVFPRGYDTQHGDEIFKLGFNYSFPLAYPDWALGPAAFLKRIKVNGFFDMGLINFDQDNLFRSAGLELRLDFRAFRLLEIDAGVRYSYLIDQEEFAPGRNPHQFDFLVISISE
jgi:hypothetical protein